MRLIEVSGILDRSSRSNYAIESSCRLKYDTYANFVKILSLAGHQQGTGDEMRYYEEHQKEWILLSIMPRDYSNWDDELDDGVCIDMSVMTLNSKIPRSPEMITNHSAAFSHLVWHEQRILDGMYPPSITSELGVNLLYSYTTTWVWFVSFRRLEGIATNYF